jgi:hypothetical protein
MPTVHMQKTQNLVSNYLLFQKPNIESTAMGAIQRTLLIVSLTKLESFTPGNIEEMIDTLS